MLSDVGRALLAPESRKKKSSCPKNILKASWVHVIHRPDDSSDDKPEYQTLVSLTLVISRYHSIEFVNKSSAGVALLVWAV